MISSINKCHRYLWVCISVIGSSNRHKDGDLFSFINGTQDRATYVYIFILSPSDATSTGLAWTCETDTFPLSRRCWRGHTKHEICLGAATMPALGTYTHMRVRRIPVLVVLVAVQPHIALRSCLEICGSINVILLPKSNRDYAHTIIGMVTTRTNTASQEHRRSGVRHLGDCLRMAWGFVWLIRKWKSCIFPELR